jgi:hypothetical protein
MATGCAPPRRFRAGGDLPCCVERRYPVGFIDPTATRILASCRRDDAGGSRRARIDVDTRYAIAPVTGDFCLPIFE